MIVTDQLIDLPPLPDSGIAVGDHPSGDDAGPAGRSVLGRIASILEAFDCNEQVLSLSDLSRRAYLPKSTVYRLAEQLCGLRWLERDCGGYRVGMRLLELGGLALQRNQLLDAARPLLYALTARIGLPVQLGVLDQGEVVYLERIQITEFRLPTRVGGRWPAYCTALGKAMLAFDESAARSVMSSPMPRLTAHTITDVNALRLDLARIRRSGVAFDHEEALDGVACIAAPIRNSGRAIGAVSVTGPVQRMNWDAMPEAVRDTAVAIWNARFSTARRLTRS